MQGQNGMCVYRACGIRSILWFSAHTYMHGLSAIMGNCVPYFAETLMLLCAIGRHRVCWCVNTKKLMTHRFLSTPELMPHCGISAHTTHICMD